MSKAQCLREILAAPSATGVPGVHDALSARMVEAAGFPMAFLSGAALAFSRFGRPDLGLVDASELEASVAAICDVTNIPLLVDIDTGFGNALNTIRTVRRLEAAGAAGLQIEDQLAPKRCGHLAGKQVIPAEEMAGKIRAAVDARRNADTVIIARTDAIAVTGFEDALDRAEHYAEAGADALFVEAPRDLEQMQAISARFAGRVPLVHNLVIGGNSPVTTVEALDRLGYRLGLFPLASLQAALPASTDLFGHIARAGETASWPGAQSDLGAINATVGLDDALASSKSYES